MSLREHIRYRAVQFIFYKGQRNHHPEYNSENTMDELAVPLQSNLAFLNYCRSIGFHNPSGNIPDTFHICDYDHLFCKHQHNIIATADEFSHSFRIQRFVA